MDEPIESGEVFTATLDGFAVFEESLLDQAQLVIPGGVKGIDLFDLNATVHVRSGATGDDVVLKPDPNIPYKCFVGGGLCDPANDILEPPAPPGLRGNTDCQPELPENPCGQFIPAQTSNDCEGVCAALNKTLQCDLHRFCITGDLRVPLEADTQRYTAAPGKTEVLFGWDDQEETTGATILQDPNDPNDGTWILPEAVYEEPTGPVGLRLAIASIPLGFECAMGVDSTGPLGVDSASELSSPTPAEALIRLAIQTEGF